MREHARPLLIGAIILITCAFLYWGWNALFEQRNVSKPAESDAARDNPMLATTRLLHATGRKVTLVASLADVDIPRLADGTLVLGAHGIMSEQQARDLLAWVRRGNTLVAQPRLMTRAELVEVATKAHKQDKSDEAEDQDSAQPLEHDEDEHSEESTTADPIGELVGVRLRVYQGPDECPRSQAAGCQKLRDARLARRAAINVPGLPYRLYLQPSLFMLDTLPRARTPLWSDDHGEQVRVFAEGRGHIVMLAQELFSNGELGRFDHGELLLELVQLHPSAKHVTLVKYLNALPWYKALWKYFSLALIAGSASLALLLWARMRRFGPVLAPEAGERRSLIEHIEASAAWYWNSQEGRQLLLDSAREDTIALLQRRAPAMARLAPDAMAEALAYACDLAQSHVIEALQRDAATQPFQFTRQIRTLQILRTHHER